MKAVISKNQFNRIKNFINETKETPKYKLLKEYETKQGSEDFPFEIGFEFIRQNGGKDFLMSKGISSWAMFKKGLLDKSIKSSDINQFKNADGQSISDTEFGKQLPMNEKKSFPDLTGDRKVTRADILKGRGVELDEKKKHSKKKLDTFDFDGDGKPFEPRDLAALRASKKLSKELDEGSDCGCGEDKDDTRYMFFSNLEQMMRQARMLLQMDEDMLEDLLNNGHDWAADHIAEAKNNMDQVFDFIMNEMNGEGEDDSWDNEEEDEDEEEREMVYEGMRLKKKAFVSKELKNHLDKNIPLYESEFKYGSQKHIELLKEVKELYKKGIIGLNETDEFIVNEFDPKPVKIKGIGEVYLGLIQEEYESDEELLSEAVYQGRKVQLGKRMRGELSGKKKFYVFVRNPKTGKVKKITFGQKGVKIKKNNPERRRSFRARHKCSQQKDKLSAAYWSCRAW